MKKKELKNLAEKFAELEYIIQMNKDSEEVKEAQRRIIELTGQVSMLDFENMMILDELIQKNLSKKLDKN
jgi:hypothetical protein